MAKAGQIKNWFTQLELQAEQQFGIHIVADGRWFHHGREIRRAGLVKLFASVLMLDEVGDFWLVTPAEKGRITVEDAPFIAVSMTVVGHDGDAKIVFYTNVGDEVQLDAAHPLNISVVPQNEGVRPYIEVRDGLLAKLSRPVYYELAEYAVLGPGGRLGVWSCSDFFPLES